MPFISFPEISGQPDAPAAVTGNPRAPTADFSGLRGAAAGLTRAANQDEVDPAPYQAIGVGMKAVGQGLQGIGGLMMKLQAAKEEAVDDTNIAEAQRALDLAEASFVKDREKMDVGEWESKWEERRRVVIDKLGESDKLSKKARQRLDLMTTRWDGQQALKTAEHSTIEMGRRAQSAGLANVRALTATGNHAAARAGLDLLSKKQYTDPMLLQREREAIDAAEKETQQREQANETIRITREQGPDAAEKYVQELDADEITKKKLGMEVKSARRETAGAIADEFEDAVAKGYLNPTDPAGINTEEEVDKWRSWDPNVRPAMRAQMKAHVRQYNDATAREVARANAPEHSSRLLSEIRKLDPESASDDQFLALRNRISMLPEGYRQLPYDVLTRKWRKYEGEDTAAEKTMLSFGERIMDSMLDGGDFGAYTHTKIKKKADGTEITDPETGLPKEYHEFNNDDFEKALTAKQKLGGMLNRWLQKNPGADEDAVTKWLNDNAGASTRIRAADDYEERTPGAGQGVMIDPSGNDLPDRPAGPPENTLLPFKQ